jgi:RNA 2',3'-cyclic 3'-phosphodiesterase
VDTRTTAGQQTGAATAREPDLHFLKMRLFAGIALADVVVRELAVVVARLQGGQSRQRSGAGRLRWTEPESWHITLQFLGSATDGQFACLSARLGEVRAGVVAVRLGELGWFDRAGVFFADVVVTPELAKLQQRVVEATSRCGFVAEARPFHPHITLARETGNERTRERGNKKSGSPRPGSGANRGTSLREVVARAGAMPAFSRFMAREFVLYESHLGREGSRYEVRGRFALGN